MRKTEKKLGKYVFVLLVIVIPILVYLLSFSSIAYNAEFVEKRMGSKWGRQQYKTVNSVVLYYLMFPDEEKPLNLSVFTGEEKQHLLDVKVLMHRIFDFLFVMLVLFFCLLALNSKFSKNGKRYSKILLYSGIITAAIPIVLYLIPFDALFASFHGIFFAPGTWVFPKDAVLLQIYPYEFWKSAAFSLFLRGFVTGWLLILAGFIVGKKK